MNKPHEIHTDTPGTLLTLDEVARRLNITGKSAKDLVRTGELNCHRIAGQLKVRSGSLDRYQGQVRLRAYTRGDDEIV